MNSTTNIYESVRLLDEYLLFHYGRADDILPKNEIPYPPHLHEAIGFTQRTVAHFDKDKKPRGLDLGCAVGASTFAMAEHCESVIGLDYSQAFITAALALKNGDDLPYRRHEQAHHFTALTATSSSPQLTQRCDFLRADAMALPTSLGSFDRVHAANLLCRLSQPLLLLEKFSSLVVEGGELIIATPCTWLEDYTPPSEWPPSDTLSWLTTILSHHFTLEHTTHEPFLIRETAHKFQWSSALLTKWRRKFLT